MDACGEGGGARPLSTSVEQIDRTYGHLLPDALERTRPALDLFLARDEEAPDPIVQVPLLGAPSDRLLIGAPRLELRDLNGIRARAKGSSTVAPRSRIRAFGHALGTSSKVGPRRPAPGG